jgi:beta-glucosidase/6-phospho-beta-glucosidase/beta-galactosidase
LGDLFKSFLQGGFECSTHKLKDGRRLDMVASTRHDEFVAEDYARLADFGIRTIREGIRWTLIESAPGQLDFSTVLPFIRAAGSAGVEIIWDILHFGWPDHLRIFEKSWVDAFERLACGFARMLRDESPPPHFIAPINEISFLSWAGGDEAYLNPFEHGRGHELKEQLVRASLAATRAIRSVLPEARIVSPEPVIHIVGRPDVEDDRRHAEEYRQSMFEAWDMLLGRSHPELGGTEASVDIIGVNYYDRNQWWNFGETIWRGEAEYRPFREILGEVYARYRRPIFVAETGTEDAKRPGWFAYISEEVCAAIQRDIPVHGICLYPILNHPGWNDDRHCRNGLWDYASADGEREAYAPLAEEIRRQEQIRQMKGCAQ